ncbi:MAG: GH3 auxin-responsive promoter family protein [Bacteroidetes bacterium]|nr:GH3 auxin-responsive promoter family protein [Bacteroidota bacterium]
MRLNFRNGMFFEFIPFNEKNFDENGQMRPNAVALNIKQVDANQEYAILLSTCSGTWRYLIGDTVKFVDLENCEIKITGRVKHFLSLCGEHLSVDNMNTAISKLSEDIGSPITEYTVKGISKNSKHEHKWFIACDKTGLDPKQIADKLDRYLCEINDDYATERKHALKDVSVTILPTSKFIGWMQEQGKFGSQNKFPRVLTNAKYNEWLSYLGLEITEFIEST